MDYFDMGTYGSIVICGENEQREIWAYISAKSTVKWYYTRMI
jgi:hypothetical protein